MWRWNVLSVSISIPFILMFLPYDYCAKWPLRIVRMVQKTCAKILLCEMTGYLNNPLIDIFLYFRYLSAWCCTDIVRRNSVLVTHGSERVMNIFMSEGKAKTTDTYKSLEFQEFKVWLQNEISTCSLTQYLSCRLNCLSVH